MKKNIHFTNEFLNYGWCNYCNEKQSFTDTGQVVKAIEDAFTDHLSDFKIEPLYALCQIVFYDDVNCPQDMVFKLSTDIGEDDDEIFFYCNGIDELKSLAEPFAEDFRITGFKTFFKS